MAFASALTDMYVYILKCENGSLYTGIAADPERRLRQHLGIIKGGAKYTRSRKVAAVACIWEDKQGNYARKLEYQLKNKLSHSDKLRLIENPHMQFSQFGIDIPDNQFIYTDPHDLNEKYGLK
ncbi:MAG: GIY-YIG nuclease family protein [Porcipelethomonas sp.]